MGILYLGTYLVGVSDCGAVVLTVACGLECYTARTRYQSVVVQFDDLQ